MSCQRREITEGVGVVAAAMQRNAIAIVNIARVIATAHITLVIAVWRATKQNPPREVLENHR